VGEAIPTGEIDGTPSHVVVRKKSLTKVGHDHSQRIIRLDRAAQAHGAQGAF
jgi:hypothetical protein